MVFSSGVYRYLDEPVFVDVGEDRISEQSLCDVLVAQGVPLAVAEDALLATRQDPPAREA